MFDINPNDIVTADTFAEMLEHQHLLPAGRNTLRNNARLRRTNGLDEYGGVFTRNGKLYVNVPRYLAWFVRAPLNQVASIETDSTR